MMLALSSSVGIGIGWSGWNCRNKVSATSYTLLGVLCKVVSVLLNVFIWDKHATVPGLAWLMVCLSCSSVYRQAPLRSEATSAARSPDKRRRLQDDVSSALGKPQAAV